MALPWVCQMFAICLAVGRFCSAQYAERDLSDVSETAGADEFDTLFGAPGVMFEYRFEIKAGKIQCFFQNLKQDAQLHFVFEVLRGADKNINMYVKRRGSHGALTNFQWTNEGNLDTVVNATDEYTFCFDNGMSRYSSKIVFFSLISYSSSDWESYAHEVEEFHAGVENFTGTLSSVHKNTNKVLQMASVSLGHMLNDWYVIRDNNTSVQRWSIILCVIIVGTSLFQVYFVRRLFNLYGAGVQSAAKPRA